MAEDLYIIQGTKEEQYRELIPQIKGLLTGEPNLIANLGNISAALKEQFGWLWVGFYMVAPAVVDGTSWAQAKTLIVADVEKFPGHIACSSLSKSEIVVPVIRNGEVLGVLDVDSTELNMFDETDRLYLEEIVTLIEL
jgi:L-methionine (R)-S-oxide reductase